MQSSSDSERWRKRSASRSIPASAIRSGMPSRNSSSGLGVRVRVDEDQRPPGLEPAAARGRAPPSSIPPSLFPRGAVMSRPSRPYVHAWYGHCSVSRRPEPSQTSEPRCRQTFRNARSVSSRSRTSTTGTSPTRVAANEPGSAHVARVTDVLPRAAEDALALELEHGGVRVPAPGQASESTALTARDATAAERSPDERSGRHRAADERTRPRDPRRGRGAARSARARDEHRVVGLAGRRRPRRTPSDATRAELALVGRARRSRALRSRRRGASPGADGEAGRAPRSSARPHAQASGPGRAPSADRRARVARSTCASRATAGVVGGAEVDDTEIKRILRQSDDPAERREAWEASKTVGAEVADDVRELARLRNEAARALGHRDWFALSLSTDELDEAELIDTLAEADRVTAEPFARWKGALDERLAARFGCAARSCGRGTTPIRSSRRRRLTAPSTSTRSSRARTSSRSRVAPCRRARPRGRRDPRAERSVPARRQEPARVLHRRRPRAATCASSRTSCRRTTRWTRCSTSSATASTTSAIRDDLPWLLRSTHLVATEASALLFGALAWRRDWLERILGLSAAEGAELEGRLRAARAVELLVFTRWVLVMNAFERALYADPEAISTRSGGSSSRATRASRRRTDRRAPDWAAKIHIAVAPVYYHTYLYGAIVGAPARRGARDRGGRDRRSARGGRAPAREALRSRPVGPLGSPRRAGVRARRSPSSRSSAQSRSARR